MNLSNNNVLWSEEIIRNFFEQFPELVGKACNIFELEANPASQDYIGLIRVEETPLNVFAVVRDGELKNMDIAMLNNELEIFNDRTVERVLALTEGELAEDETMSGGGYFPEDDQSYNLYNADDDFLGQTFVDPSSVTAMIPNYYAFHSGMPKTASLKKNQFEAIIDSALMKNLDFESKVKLAKLTQDRHKFYPETSSTSIGYDVDKDEVYCNFYRFDGEKVAKVTKKLSEEEAEEIGLEKVADIILGLKEVPTVGTMKIASVHQNKEIKLPKIQNNFGFFKGASEKNVPGVIKKSYTIDSLNGKMEKKAYGMSGVFNDQDKVFFKRVTSEGMQGKVSKEASADILDNGKFSIGSTVVFIGDEEMSTPLKIASIGKESIYCKNEFNEVIKVAAQEGLKRPLFHSETSTLYIPGNTKLSFVSSSEGMSIFPLESESLKLDISDMFSEHIEANVKEANGKTQIKIYIKKKDKEYHVRAVTMSGKEVLKPIFFKGEEALKEQLKELGVAAGACHGIADNMKSTNDAPSIEITGYVDEESVKDFKSASYEVSENQKKIVKLAYELADENNYEDALKIFGASVINPKTVESFEKLDEYITELKSKLLGFALYMKITGDDNKCATILEGIESLEEVKNI